MKEQEQLIQKHATELLEHFDSVRIFVTKHNGGGEETAAFNFGGGNYYAQLGQVREWLSIQDQYQREFAKSNT